MGNKVSSMLQDEEIEAISEETGFSAAQVERLYSRFTSLDKSGICGSLSRDDFLRVPELAINPLCDRIVHMFFVDCDDDHDRINFRQFMKVLATFRSSSTKQHQLNQSNNNNDNNNSNTNNHHSQNSHQQQQQQKDQNQTSSLDESATSNGSKHQDGIQNILSSLSQSSFMHSRHSSCDGFLNYYHPVQHHTTNQHSIHYVASTTHVNSIHGQHPSASHLNHHHNHHHHHHHNGVGSHINGTNHNNNNIICPLDPDEPTNSRKQRLFFMFKIYDVDNDNRISLDDLKTILKMMVGTYVDDERVKRIAERSFHEADKDSDGFIDFNEFCAAFNRKDIDESLKVKFSTH